MAEIKGIDFAWDKPSPAEILKVGAHWAAGYISFDATKDLTQSEIHSYVSAGIPIVLASESTATRALQGSHAGIFDAQYARNRLAQLGMKDAVVHFAVDTDADWAQVQPYFEGVFNQWQSKRQIGVYGGIRVIEGAYNWGLRYLWQTDAWSGGIWSPHATIRQEGGTLFGGQADWDDAITPDWGQWPRFVSPVPPNSVPKFEENDVIAYFDIQAGKVRDIPVEPAGTDAAPKGGAKNGPMWFAGTPTEGQKGTLKVTYHTYAHGWGTPAEWPVGGDEIKTTITLPTDGSVDKLRVECDVDFTAYICGRQVQ